MSGFEKELVRQHSKIFRALKNVCLKSTENRGKSDLGSMRVCGVVLRGLLSLSSIIPICEA